MSLLHAERIDTDFFQSQEIIARKYLEHFCAYLNAQEDIKDFCGHRFEGGETIGHSGKVVGISFDHFGETQLELINCHHIVAFRLESRSFDDHLTTFTFEFEIDDKSLLDMLPVNVKKYLELGGYEDNEESDDLLLD